MPKTKPAAGGALPAHDYQNPVTAIANMLSIMNVCCFALEGVEDWNDEIRQRATLDIRRTLEMAVAYGWDAMGAVETALAKKGGAA